MKVDFVVRCDATQRAGGDLTQVRCYATELEELGVDVEIVPMRFDTELRAGAIAHFVNTARPYELLAAVKAARDRKIVVSPIHHSLGDFRRMRRAETGQGLRSQLGRLPEPVREWLATTARRAASPLDSTAQVAAHAVTSIPSVAGVWRRVGSVLDSASAVTTLSSVEEARLRAETGWSGMNAVRIPNGGPTTPVDPVEWEARSEVLVTVGRIEPRKRQLEIAKIAASMGVPVKFIGAPNESVPNYVHEFTQVVAQNPLLTWLGARSHEEVCSILRESRVLLNGSWAEVQSLVDIEAISNGCRVFGTLTGSTYEYCPDSTRVFGPQDLETLILCAGESARTEAYDAKKVASSYPYTWRGAASKLVQIYERCASD